MPDTIVTPDQINNDDSDFLFQGRLYQGLGGEQYELRERFEHNEQALTVLDAARETADRDAAALASRVGTLETRTQNLTSDQTGQAGVLREQGERIEAVETKLDEHADAAEIHVSDTLRDHPDNAERHLPGGAAEQDFLSFVAGAPAWVKGPTGTTIIGGGEITADALFTAMVEMIAMNWESDANTSFNHPPGDYKAVRGGVYGERFVFVGNRGTIAWSYRGNKWWPADNKPFEEADIYGICYGADTGNTPLYMAIDSSNKYSFSANGRAWMNAMTYTGDPAFRCCCYGNQTFMIFGRRGTILRATFSQYQDPWITNAQGKRTGVDWLTQNNSASELEGINCCCFGLGHFVAGGDLGKIIRSKDGANWTIQNMTPFEASAIQSMAYGNGRIVAVGQNGKIAITTDPDVVNWTLIEEKPFGTETAIYSVTFGGGIFIAADYYGRIATSSDGETWKLWLPQTEQSVVRAIAYGNMSIVIGNDNGVLSVSDSISKRFTNFDRGEFLEYVDANADWFTQIETEFATFFPHIQEALANKPDLGDAPAQPQSLVTRNEGNSVWYVGVTGDSPDAAPLDHQHPSNLVIGDGLKSRPLTEHGSLGVSTMAARYDHEHSWEGLVLVTMIGAPGGVVPLDDDKLIPLQYMRNGWDFDGLYSTLNRQNISRWYIQPDAMFQDITSDAVIYAVASNTRTIVVVGEKGRIAYGSHVKRLKRAANQPFGEERQPGSGPVVGVACGADRDGADLFIAVDTTNRYSLSRDGENWSVPRELPGGDIEGIMHGGGMFLIWCSDGYIYRSAWEGGELVFLPQSSTPLDTEGLRSIVFHNGRYVGVGVDGKAVTSPDADGWELETTPDGTPSLLCAFAAENEVVAVGLGGTVISTADDGKTWIKRTSGRTEDFYSGCYYDGLYLVAGKNGVLISSENLAAGFTSPYDTKISSIIRAVHRHSGVYILCSDAGQIAVCATFAEILGMIFETDTLSPYNDLLLPLQKEADPGISNRFARGDHVHSWDGLVTVAMVGMPDGVASLGPDGIVPKTQLPPMEIDVEQIVNYLVGGHELEFLEQNSPFPRGPGVSTIIHDAATAVIDGTGVYVMVGEPGIAWSDNVAQWQMAATQPFGTVPVVGVESGVDDLQQPLFIAIDTNRRYSVSRTGKNDWSAAVELDGDYDFEAICYYNRTFLVLCSNGVILRSVFADGELVGWDEQADSPNITERLNKIVGGNSLYLGVGNGGRIRYSHDASHFSVAVSPTTQDLLSACHGKGTFVIGCADGSLLTGTDETDIALAAAKPFKNSTAAITGLGYSHEDGLFVATNADGGIATSGNLADWAEYASPSVVRIKAVTSGGNRIVLGDDAGNIMASRVAVEIVIPGVNLDGYAKITYVDNAIAEALEGFDPGEIPENMVVAGDVTLDEVTGLYSAKVLDGDGLPTGETVTFKTLLDPPEDEGCDCDPTVPGRLAAVEAALLGLEAAIDNQSEVIG